MSTDSASALPRLSAPRRGVNGLLVRAWGGRDLRLTVLAREEPAERFVRLRVDLDGLLARDEVYPTYWLRLWFETPSGKGHQRAYTVVAPEPATGTGWLEFYLHPGIASDWARSAAPGDGIDATVLNGRDPLAHSPTHLLMVGDGASYPAIADTLRRTGELPVTALLQAHDPEDPQIMPLPARDGAEARWLAPEQDVVAAALEAVSAAPEGTNVWVALEGAPTRRLAGALRRGLGLPKERVHSLAYWKRS